MLKSFFFITCVFISCLTSGVSLEAHFKPYISPGTNGAEAHIKDRHWFNAKTPKASHFYQWMTMQKLNKLASVTLNNGSQKVQPNGLHVHEYTFKKPIGKDSSNKPARTLRVITDPKRSTNQNLYVVTAFTV